MRIDENGRIRLDFKFGVIDEIWAPITRIYHNNKIYHVATGYYISTHGNVKRNGNILKQSKITNIKGKYYPMVSISVIDDGVTRCKNVKVHRLVAMYFVFNINRDDQVNHIDGVKTNPHYLNLEWCDSDYNIKHAVDNNLIRTLYDENIIHEICKLLELGMFHNDIRERIDELKIYPSSVSKSLVKGLRCGKVWKHITSQYNIIKAQTNYNRLQKIKFTDTQRHIICKDISLGLNCSALRNKYDWFNARSKNSCIELIKDIRNGSRWRSISSKYDII